MAKLDITDLLGVRFKDHGRNLEEGFDCYGLAIEVSKRLGHELKDVWYIKGNERTFTEKAEEVITEMSQNVIETDELELGNLVVFSDENGNMVHIGVMLNDERFIHCSKFGVNVQILREYYRNNWKVYKWRQ